MNGGLAPVVQRDLLPRPAGTGVGAVVLLGVGLVTGLIGALSAFAAPAPLGPAGWALGLASAVTGNLWLASGLVHSGRTRLGPADFVTLARATLVCGVAALVADAFTRPLHVAALPLLVGLASIALSLDWVDGRVARRTGTVSSLGARFDMEVDAFLILVLSVHVARDFGGWVLAIGVARYALLAAGRLVPWLNRPAPPRHWCKVVAVIQGVVLIVAAADVLPRSVATVLLALALALLAESFGREVLWLWRTRQPAAGATTGAAGAKAGTAGAKAGTLLAAVLVWVALTLPNRIGALEPAAFVRLPLEAPVYAALVLVVAARARAAVALVAGTALGLLTVLKVMDMAFLEALNRPFDLVTDWSYAGSLVGLMRDSFGSAPGTIMLVVAAASLLALLVLVPLALLRLTRALARLPTGRRRFTWQTVVGIATAWLLLAVTGTQLGGTAVASDGAARYAYRHLTEVPAAIRDRRVFEEATIDDPLRRVPAGELLGGLRGKDVLFVFVESYGRVAVQDSSFSPGVNAVLDAGTRRLAAEGFSTRSAFLTSPTFGAISWLAHSTLQSGVWVDSQQKYDVLVESRRSTLSHAFARAGWRTVGDVPANTEDWPQARFYDYDQLYDSRNVGYAGPRFGYPTMPDQFTLDAFHRLELAKTGRPAVMAEIDLISSHAPWSRTPRMVDPRTVGDGSVFAGMPASLPSEKDIWPSPTRVRAAYGRAVEYSLNALVSFIAHHGTDQTVLVVLGDHQPATIVSGERAGYDVPISVIARDPAVLERIDGWAWNEGLRPPPDAPVWRMDDFRDRFLEAYAQ